MIVTSFRAILLLILLVSSTFTSLIFTGAYATTNLVTVTASNNGMITTLHFTNNGENTSDISSVILQIAQGGNFKSFKSDKGWFGIKSSPNTLTFSSTNPTKPGQSVNFVVKTDQSNPVITWKASNSNNNELGSGEIGTSSTEIPTNPTGTTTNPTGTPTNPPGVLDGSSFRIIPSNPRAGSDVRVIGLSFATISSLDLYIGTNKISSFTTDNKGNFIITTKIPDDQSIGNVSFFVKDQIGNSKTFNTIIHEARQRNIVNQNIPLTVVADSIYHRGETKIVSGTASPGSTLTLTILDSSGNSLTTFTTTADRTGHYSLTRTIPIDAPFGSYTLVVSDGKNKVSKSNNIVTTHQIIISTSQSKIDPGQSIVINGTSISNEPVSFRIDDPIGNPILEKDVNVTSDGKIAIGYTTDSAAVKGTYKVIVSQGNDQVTAFFGVGENPVPQLTLSMDKLNYQNVDKPTINISGPPSSTLNLVIIDPSGKQKFADTIHLDPNGFVTYSFNVTSYNPGIYATVVQRGNDKAVTNFAVGLQTGSGAITMKTVKDTYLLGDNIIILGKSNPNTLLRIKLTDTNGVIEKSQDTFTDKAGIFSSTDFRIPGDGTPGIWKLEATSGVNHVSVDLTVKSGHEGISVKLDKVPPIYSRGNIVTISGTGAGNSADTIINILDTNSTKISSLDISSTNRGDFSTVWTIPTTFGPGTYTIQVKSITGQTTIKITIQ